MQKESYPVIIAGAGPAGLAASLTLTARKISHCIVDANASAIHKPGDALPPNVKPLLKQLGILDLLERAPHTPYYGNHSIWGSNSVQEEEFIGNVFGHGYLLDRMHFEKQLRQLVENNNTPFFQGYQIKDVKEKQGVETLIRSRSNQIQLQAQYIMDATGRKASVCRHLGVKKKEMDQQLSFSFWHQMDRPIPRQIWIEATENGWWYLSPAEKSRVNCMFFTLKELIPPKNETATFLAHERSKTQQIQKIIEPAVHELLDYKLMPSGTSYLQQPYGQHWLAIGDAAFSFDPISSYGITSALATGYYGAQAISSALSKEPDAFMTYHHILKNGASVYLQKLVQQYSVEKRWSNSYYWKNRLR
jgi:flavin-dependent dehydrogenase